MAYRATRRGSACVTKASQGETMYSKSNCTTHRHRLRVEQASIRRLTPLAVIWVAAIQAGATSNSTSAINETTTHKRAETELWKQCFARQRECVLHPGTLSPRMRGESSRGKGMRRKINLRAERSNE